MEKHFLEDLLTEITVSGKEQSNAVKVYMKDIADQILEDDMGNVICVVNPDSPKKIMLSAHADEIGLVISNITESGRLQVVERGGIISQNYPGQSVMIKTKKGIVYGVVESTRELIKKQDLKTSDFLIDIGAKTKAEALEMVHVGDPIVLDTRIRRMMNGRFSGRALDDRLGVYIIMEALKKAKEQGCTVGIYAAATVGEETTKSGAYWCSTRIHPDMAIVVDVTYCSDYQRVNPADMGKVELGKGPVLCDSPIMAKKLNEKLEKCAEEKQISIQWEVASGWTHTDGDKIHFSNQGVSTALVSIPLRYMHSPAEVADEKDVQGCIDLIAEFLCKINK